jgi:hypothetical protein
VEQNDRGLTAFNRNSDIDLGKATTGEICVDMQRRTLGRNCYINTGRAEVQCGLWVPTQHLL